MVDRFSFVCFSPGRCLLENEYRFQFQFAIMGDSSMRLGKSVIDLFAAVQFRKHVLFSNICHVICHIQRTTKCLKLSMTSRPHLQKPLAFKRVIISFYIKLILSRGIGGRLSIGMAKLDTFPPIMSPL